MTPDEAIIWRLLGRLVALREGRGGPLPKDMAALTARLGPEALNRVLAGIVEGSLVVLPETRELLVNLLRGETEFKLELRRQRRGGRTGDVQALEVAGFIYKEEISNGGKLEAAVQAAMDEFGLKRRQVFELMKRGTDQAERLGRGIPRDGADGAV
jgi:hypothetical protein